MKSFRDGRYVVLRILGEGSQGSTFEAVDKREGRLVALKSFAVRGARQWKDVELAEREARVLSSLSHRDLPAYVEHFEEEGALVLVMERMEGVSLTSYAKGGGKWREADVIGLLQQAAGVLAYLHGQSPPIIHRDLKPSNVVRRPDSSFAFVDFGAVRDRLRPEGGSTVVGTFGYMAPEQFQGRACPASDVYSIGATALWMLTLSEPEKLPHKGLAIDVAAALGPRRSPNLVTVLTAMLQVDPEKRPPSIAPLLAGFEVRGRTVRAGIAQPKPESTPKADAAPAAPAAPKASPPADASRDGLRLLRRALPILWIMAGLSWWALGYRSAMSFTIGLIVLSIVARVYRPERRSLHGPGPKNYWQKGTTKVRYVLHDEEQPPGERVRVADPVRGEEGEAEERHAPDEAGRRGARR
jgi:serine/threonine protein kinase